MTVANTITTLLVPLDGSEIAERALQQAQHCCVAGQVAEVATLFLHLVDAQFLQPLLSTVGQLEMARRAEEDRRQVDAQLVRTSALLGEKTNALEATLASVSQGIVKVDADGKIRVFDAFGSTTPLVEFEPLAGRSEPLWVHISSCPRWAYGKTPSVEVTSPTPLKAIKVAPVPGK